MDKVIRKKDAGNGASKRLPYARPQMAKLGDIREKTLGTGDVAPSDTD